MKEVEIKIKLPDPSRAEDLLKAAGCILGSPTHQRDIIYINYPRPFIEFQTGDIFLRIRRTSKSAVLTFKQGEEMASVEHETTIENPDAMHSMLLALGFRPEVEVSKTRRKGTLKNYEVCVDEVEGLGSFLELESITNEEPSIVQSNMIETLHTIGITTEDRVMNGYDTLIWLAQHTTNTQ